MKFTPGRTDPNRRMMLAIASLVFSLALLGLLVSSRAPAAPVPITAFKPGEKLVMKIYWEFVPAGVAELTVLPDTKIGGEPARHFMFTVKTNNFADTFYKVRDRIDAYTDLAMTRSLRYVKSQHEGGTHHEVVVEFDWKNKKALFTEDGRLAKTTDITPGTFDPLSFFYRLRLMSLKTGDAVEVPVTDGSKHVLAQGRVISSEVMKVADRKMKVALFEPELKHIGGVFKQSPDAKLQIWFSDDGKKVPVRIKSGVVVGNFTARLTEARNVW